MRGTVLSVFFTTFFSSGYRRRDSRSTFGKAYSAEQWCMVRPPARMRGGRRGPSGPRLAHAIGAFCCTGASCTRKWHGTCIRLGPLSHCKESRSVTIFIHITGSSGPGFGLRPGCGAAGGGLRNWLWNNVCKRPASFARVVGGLPVRSNRNIV